MPLPFLLAQLVPALPYRIRQDCPQPHRDTHARAPEKFLHGMATSPSGAWRWASGVWRLTGRASAYERASVRVQVHQAYTYKRADDMIVTSPTLDISSRVAIKYPGLRTTTLADRAPGIRMEFSMGPGPDSAHHPDMLG